MGNESAFANGDFEKLDISQFTTQEIIEDLIMIHEDIEREFFIECDSEYPVESKEKTKNFLMCPYQSKIDPELFAPYMNSVQQPNYKSTNNQMCD